MFGRERERHWKPTDGERFIKFIFQAGKKTFFYKVSEFSWQTFLSFFRQKADRGAFCSPDMATSLTSIIWAGYVTEVIRASLQVVKSYRPIVSNAKPRFNGRTDWLHSFECQRIKKHFVQPPSPPLSCPLSFLLTCQNNFINCFEICIIQNNPSFYGLSLLLCRQHTRWHTLSHAHTHNLSPAHDNPDNNSRKKYNWPQV